jgi:hypothetical protein
MVFAGYFGERMGDAVAVGDDDLRRISLGKRAYSMQSLGKPNSIAD